MTPLPPDTAEGNLSTGSTRGLADRPCRTVRPGTENRPNAETHALAVRASLGVATGIAGGSVA